MNLNCQSNFSVSDLNLDSTSHPNAMPFEMTLLYLDEPSDQAPHGAQGHRIYVPEDVAKKRLNGLVDMGVNVDDDLEGHNPQKKVGTIRKAWIDGNEVKVSGVIWKKDFPSVADDLKQQKRKLGASMELADVYVRDANDPIWYLEDFKFTGATILKKDHAAYEHTDLAASRHFVNAIAAAREATLAVRFFGSRQRMIERSAERGVRLALLRSGQTRTAKRT